MIFFHLSKYLSIVTITQQLNLTLYLKLNYIVVLR